MKEETEETLTAIVIATVIIAIVGTIILAIWFDNLILKAMGTLIVLIIFYMFSQRYSRL
jgi:uncharacterized membrane protein YfcA